MIKNEIRLFNSQTSALIIEGGAMRSVFSAGLLDGFIQHQFKPFDFYIGVSAGASNLVAFLTGKPGISLRIFQNSASNKNFINYPRFIRGGHLIDLDWLSEIIFSDSKLGLKPSISNVKPFYVCVTNVTTGKPHYIKATQDNIKYIIKASTALPLLYRDFPEIGNQAMTDGGIAQGIPIAEAIRLGAKRIMVVRSRPKPYMKKDTLGHQFLRWKMKKYPALIATMRNRVKIHKESIALIRNPPPNVKIVEICPPDNFSVGQFDCNSKQLIQGHKYGLETAKKAIKHWLSIID